jgi:hypothetical protein
LADEDDDDDENGAEVSAADVVDEPAGAVAGARCTTFTGAATRRNLGGADNVGRSGFGGGEALVICYK